jgi:DNA-binding SARP family transcriptional activator
MNIKFLPPRIAKALDMTLFKKVTIIEAGAGYGKTTLLSQWIEERKIPCHWYPSDHFPDMPWTNVDPTNQSRLTNEFESIPFLLVLDNWHTSSGDRDMIKIFDDLALNSPPHVHIILCTRVTPLLPSLARLEAEDAILRIDECVLAFKSEEISSFIARSSGVILSLEQIEWLERETEGWPLALHLTGRTIAKALRWDPEEVKKVWLEKIFPYFQTEVLEGLPAEIQEFLLTLAVPSEISLEVFSPLLGLDKYLKNLKRVTQNHAFLFCSADTWRYHALFQAFLQSKIEQNIPFFQDLTLRIGNLYLNLGRPIEAIPYLVRATAYPEAGWVLEEIISALPREHWLETLEKLLSHFPGEADKHLTKALLTFGEGLAKSGRGNDALSWLRRASLGFGQLGDDVGITRSLCAMGTVYATMGLTEEAEAIYSQAKREVPSDEKSRAVVLAYLTRYEQLVTCARENCIVPRLHIQCFGSFELFRGKEPLNYRKWRHKALQVLKYLTVQPVHKAAKEQLLDLFWPDESPSKASNSYYVTLHSLRQGLASGLPKTVNYLKVERGTVSLVPELLAKVDIKEFTYKVQEGHRLWPISPAQAVQCFQSATDLYHGDLLNGDLYEEWLFPLRDQLKSQYLESLTYMAGHATTNGDLEYSLKLLNKVIRRDATNEQVIRDAMRLMSCLGRRSEALQCYQRLCRLLQEELNTEPEQETLRLYNALLCK